MAGRILVIGAGGHARPVIEALLAQGFAVAGLLDDGAAAGPVLGHKLLGGTGRLAGLRAEGLDAAVIAIGGNAARARLGALCRQAGFALPVVLHPAALVSPSAVIGPGAQVMARAVIGPEAALGPLCLVNTGAIVEHECRVGEAAHLGPGAVLCGGASLGPRAWLGAGAVVRAGVAIGADVVIGIGEAVLSGATGGGAAAMPKGGM
jgi:UDP-perosamine 4-acetyltransferase